MAWWDTLMEQGAVLPGVEPPTIPAGGTSKDAYYPDDNKFGRVLESIMKQQKNIMEEEEKRQKKLKNDIDTYTTLREAGYSSKRAFEALQSGELGEPPLGEAKDNKTSNIKEYEYLKDTVGLPKKESVSYAFGGREVSVRDVIKKVNEGEMTFDEAIEQMPDKEAQINKIRKSQMNRALLKEKLVKLPVKQVGFFHFVSRSKKGYANMNEATKKLSSKIKTYADLIDLYENVNKYSAGGVNVKALVDYYKDEFKTLARKGLIKPQK